MYPGPDRFAWKIAQALILRVAEHEPVAGVPQDECLGNRLDRVAQALVGGRRQLRLAPALGDVEGDADEACGAGFFVLDDFRPLAQPHPAPVGRAHPKLDVHAVAAPIYGGPRDRLQAFVLRMHPGLQVGDRPMAGTLAEFEHVEHRGRPDDPPALQIPGPQPAAAAIERQFNARAAAPLLADALALASDIGGIEAARRDDERHRDAEQKNGHPRRAAPDREMNVDGRSESDLPCRRRQVSHRSELIAFAIRRDANHAGLFDVGNRKPFRSEVSGWWPVCRVLLRVERNPPAVAIDQDRLGEALVGMGCENAVENVGWGRLRRGRQRRIEPRGENGRAHVDLARSRAQGQIAFEPQMLERQSDDAHDGEGDANRRG